MLAVNKVKTVRLALCSGSAVDEVTITSKTIETTRK